MTRPFRLPTAFALLALLASTAAGGSAAEPVPDRRARSAPEGWVPLFDGKTLAGWGDLEGEPVPGWTVRDGTICLPPLEEGEKVGSLYTQREYGDFVLEFEWRIALEGNSGVKYRMRDYDGRYLGPEYQILDNTGDRGRGPRTHGNTTGALYVLHPVDLSRWKVKPLDEWNHSRIVARGTRFEHWLNGEKLLEVDTATEAFRAAVARSKFRRWPHYAQNPRGRIMLQSHGSGVRFRRLRIRELKGAALPAPPPPPAG